MTAFLALLAALNAAPGPTIGPIGPIAKIEQTAVFAGGCFWGVEAVFEHVKGVIRVTSGYAGGSVASPTYEEVSSGNTGHAESVQVVFDPAQVSYGTLMQIFFSVAHDPTQLNRQGPDDGTQYRSAIFYMNDDQKREAEAYVAQLTKAKTFSRPIVTQITRLDKFYAAEDYHQDFAEKNPMHPYILINDRPKVIALKRQFPQLYREIGKSVATEKGSK
jgi:peptide-methionine (S)-S-oxide reductase